MKPHKISTHLDYSDSCCFHIFLLFVWLSWNFCKVSGNLISNWTWKFELSIFKNKKVLFLKKKLSHYQYQNKKKFVYWLNFPEGFEKNSRRKSGEIASQTPVEYCVSFFKKNWLIFCKILSYWLFLLFVE